MNKIAISVNNVSKTFRIPHEKISTLRGAFVSLPKKMFGPLRRSFSEASKTGAFKSKSYEKFKALSNVSFEVKKGEFFGIIGRNGSGKSTLLKILAGIYTADKGDVKINGLISPFLELGIGFNPELSGRDNIYLNASVLGLTKKQIDNKFDDIVAFSELGRFIDQKIKNYSSGMQVRLAFSVAIHANREILLMDEVLAVGDSNFQGKCLEEFNKYKEQGKTVILVTHDIATVQRYCDRALLLRDGKIEMLGNPEKVGNKYIFQNMSDEEKRIFNEERRQRLKSEKEAERKEKSSSSLSKGGRSSQEEEIGKPQPKIAEITKVEFLDKNEKIKNVFQTGEDITARIYYKSRKAIKKPVFGVAVYTDNEIHLSGPNTRTSNFEIDFIKGTGYVDFIISKNPLFTGLYKFTCAIFDWKCVTPFDFKDRAYKFRIISSEENQNGLLKLKTLWKK